MKLLTMLLLSTYLGACADRAPLPGQDNTGRERPQGTSQDAAPGIVFIVTPLVSGNAGDAGQVDVAWSQNDYADSVNVVLTNAEGLILDDVNIDLTGEFVMEGDGVPSNDETTRQTVRWVSFESVNVDSLALTETGRLLAVVRPSILWRDFRDLAAPDLTVDSLLVRCRLKDGREFDAGLVFLWD